jgi:hypothetical protein
MTGRASVVTSTRIARTVKRPRFGWRPVISMTRPTWIQVRPRLLRSPWA